MRIVILIIFLFISFFRLDAKFGWEKLNSGTELFLYGVCFVDSLYGWAVGDEGIILKTTDGGSTWKEKDANIGSWLLSVHFIDKYNGWVCGDFGDLRKTTDGGETWKIIHSITYPEVLNSIYFADKNNGWAVGPQGIIHSSDGGNNWEFQYGDSLKATKSIFFINNQVGWCCGANGEILRTVDGGKNWTKQKNPNSGIIYDIYFLNLSLGWAVSRHEPKILKTTDGGNNWFAPSSEISGFFKRIKFIDEKNGWAVGLDGIIRTTDGGKTWKYQMHDAQYNLWWADFTDANKGWAVGGNGCILKTDNGGYKFIIDFTANKLIGQAPLSTTFTNLTQGEYNSLRWEFGDGGTHTTSNPVYIYQAPGKYNVKLVASDGIFSDSLIKYNYITVTNPDELIADFKADTTTGIEPLTVQFTDLSQGNPQEWLWEFGDGGTHTTQNPLHVYQNSGTYTVKLTIKRNGYEANEVKSNYIVVHKAINVPEMTPANDIKISPNPNQSKFTINFYNKKLCNLHINLISISGKKILDFGSQMIFEGKYSRTFDLSKSMNQLSNGIYYLDFQFKYENHTTNIFKKLIIMR